VRDRKGRANSEASLVLNVSLPPMPEGWCAHGSSGEGGAAGVPEAVGWEANKERRLSPRWVAQESMELGRGEWGWMRQKVVVCKRWWVGTPTRRGGLRPG